MNIIIKGTNVVETLSIIDPDSGVDYVADFIGNEGALADGQFVWDEEQDAYVAEKETFDWWDAVIKDNQELDYRVHDLVQEYGREEVYKVTDEAGGGDLEDHAASVNQALDEAFGPAESGATA